MKHTDLRAIAMSHSEIWGTHHAILVSMDEAAPETVTLRCSICDEWEISGEFEGRQIEEDHWLLF